MAVAGHTLGGAPMKPFSRVLRLPALAVLLPCQFIAVLTFQWLTLEREAAAYRDHEAAQRVVANLRRDLFTALRDTGNLAAHVLDDVAPGRPFFGPPPSIDPLVSDAYVFSPSGEPVAPADPNAALARAIDQFRQDMVAGRSRNPGVLAASHLDRARRSLAAGNTAAAERHGGEIARCCRGARDEHGMSFSLYGAWLRVVATKGQPSADETVAHIGRELRELIEEGPLGAPGDGTQVALLAARAKNAPALGELVPVVDRLSADVRRRTDTGRLAAQWVAQADLRATDLGWVLINALGRGTSVAALSRVRDGRAVVMLLDPGGRDRGSDSGLRATNPSPSTCAVPTTARERLRRWQFLFSSKLRPPRRLSWGRRAPIPPQSAGAGSCSSRP